MTDSTEKKIPSVIVLLDEFEFDTALFETYWVSTIQHRKHPERQGKQMVRVWKPAYIEAGLEPPTGARKDKPDILIEPLPLKVGTLPTTLEFGEPEAEVPPVSAKLAPSSSLLVKRKEPEPEPKPFNLDDEIDKILAEDSELGAIFLEEVAKLGNSYRTAPIFRV